MTDSEKKGLIPFHETQAVAMMPSEQQWNRMNDQAQMLVRSGFLPPALNTKEKALAVMLKGYEMGLPTMQALSQLYVVGQKIGIQGEGMLALIRSRCPGAQVDFIETSAERCVIEAERSGSKRHRFEFTIADAQAMQLVNKPGANYVKQPAVMLQWRCVAKMARAMFSDVLMGCKYTPDELGANLDEKGEPIDVTNDTTIESKKEKGAKVNAAFSQHHIAPDKPKAPAPTPDQVKDAKSEQDESVRTKLIQQVLDAKTMMGLGKDELLAYINDIFGKGSEKLTNEELKHLVEKMNNDITGK